jgi:hypothetical protein
MSDIQKIFFTSIGYEPRTFFHRRVPYISVNLMSDIGYRMKVYSDIQHNAGLHSFQPDVRSCDIKLSPILLITDIGVSAHLWIYRTIKIPKIISFPKLVIFSNFFFKLITPFIVEIKINWKHGNAHNFLNFKIL